MVQFYNKYIFHYKKPPLVICLNIPTSDRKPHDRRGDSHLVVDNEVAMQQQSVDSAVEVLSGVDQLIKVETVVEVGGDSVKERNRRFALSRVHHPSVPEGGEYAKHGVHGGRVAESECHLVEL